MSRPVIVDLFVEDRAHEEFLKPLISRIASEEGIQVSTRVRSARGGHARAIQELKLYGKLLEKNALGEEHPDMLIVAIDGNCTTFAKKRTEIQTTVRVPSFDRLVVACPDPHVERWYLADPNSFQSVVGQRPIVSREKCMRDYYKKALTRAVREAGHPVTLGGIEFAPELVAAMDLHRAGRTDHSLRAFVDELRAKLRQASNR